MLTKLSCLLYHLMEWVDGERIRGFVLVPYRKAEAIKLLCCEIIGNDVHGIYRRRIRHTWRHTIGSGNYGPTVVMRCWKTSREIF